MNRETVLEKIIPMLSRLTEEEITEDSELLDDLGVSSMDVLMLLVKLEELFKIKIPEKLIRKMVTVGDMADVICGVING